ncbi:MAG: hypothetical protein GY938_24565 [Ketobacter sp.]|nr:hypothetical protein [Ketobacter sp.]
MNWAARFSLPCFVVNFGYFAHPNGCDQRRAAQERARNGRQDARRRQGYFSRGFGWPGRTRTLLA